MIGIMNQVYSDVIKASAGIVQDMFSKVGLNVFLVVLREGGLLVPASCLPGGF